MSDKIPNIDDVIDEICRKVKSPKGHDVDASEARAFNRQYWFCILRMPVEIRAKFIAKNLIYYGRELKKGAKK